LVPIHLGKTSLDQINSIGCIKTAASLEETKTKGMDGIYILLERLMEQDTHHQDEEHNVGRERSSVLSKSW
jgi:hypothetical protein